jgi:hypothetical protein
MARKPSVGSRPVVAGIPVEPAGQRRQQVVVLRRPGLGFGLRPRPRHFEPDRAGQDVVEDVRQADLGLHGGHPVGIGGLAIAFQPQRQVGHRGQHRRLPEGAGKPVVGIEGAVEQPRHRGGELQLLGAAEQVAVPPEHLDAEALGVGIVDAAADDARQRSATTMVIGMVPSGSSCRPASRARFRRRRGRGAASRRGA